MSTIPVSKSVIGVCYVNQDGSYLGRFLGISRGQEYMEGPFAGRFRPIYAFENGIINDSYPIEKVTATPCKNGGKRKGTRKTRRNKRINNTRCI